MRKYIVLLVAGCCYFLSSTAQNKYAVNLIPTQLLAHANVVKRMEEIRVDIRDAGNATIIHKYALTIFNTGGDGEAELVEWYGQLIGIESVEGTLYDASGKKNKIA